MVTQKLPLPVLLAALGCALAGPLGAASGAGQEPASIDWQVGSYDDARTKARSEQRALCLYFWAEGSEHCKTLFQGPLSQPEVAAALAGHVCYSADLGGSGRTLLDRYRVSVLPTVLLTRADGEPLDAIVGAVTTQEFLSQLSRIQGGIDTVPALRQRVGEAPDDLDLRLQLALKLDHVGLVDESHAIIAAIRAEDPKGRTLVGARLAFWEVRDRLLAELDATSDLTQVDLGPLHKHVRSIRHDIVRFEAYQWLAAAEGARGSRGPARAMLASAWEVVPEPQRAEWGVAITATFFDQRDELSRREKRLMLEVARELEKLADKFDAEREAASSRGEILQEPDVPPRVQAHTALACAFFVNGRKGDARREAVAAIELAPEDGELKRVLDPIIAR